MLMNMAQNIVYTSTNIVMDSQVWGEKGEGERERERGGEGGEKERERMGCMESFTSFATL